MVLMNEQMKGEGRDLGEFQQVGTPVPHTSGDSQGWWKPSGAPETAWGCSRATTWCGASTRHQQLL